MRSSFLQILSSGLAAPPRLRSYSRHQADVGLGTISTQISEGHLRPLSRPRPPLFPGRVANGSHLLQGSSSSSWSLSVTDPSITVSSLSQSGAWAPSAISTSHSESFLSSGSDFSISAKEKKKKKNALSVNVNCELKTKSLGGSRASLPVQGANPPRGRRQEQGPAPRCQRWQHAASRGSRVPRAAPPLPAPPSPPLPWPEVPPPRAHARRLRVSPPPGARPVTTSAFRAFSW